VYGSCCGPQEANPGRGSESEIETKAIDDIAKDNISRTIIFYAHQMLRTIVLCYRDFESWHLLKVHG
jgi:Ca2+-transporting ATPase